MGNSWILLLLLLFTENGTFNLPGIMTTWEFESESTASTNDSVPKEMKMCSPTTTVCNNGRNVSVVALQIPLATMGIATTESLKHTTPTTPPTSPGVSNSAGLTEQNTPTFETPKKELEATITTSSKGIGLSDSTLKNRESSRSIASYDMATLTKSINQSLKATLKTSNSLVNEQESSVSTDSQTSTVTTIPTVLNTLSSGFLASGSVITTVSEKSATGMVPTLNKSTNRTVPLPMTTNAVIYDILETLSTQGTATIGTPMPGVEGETTASTTDLMGSTLPETSNSPATHTSFHSTESTPSPDAHLTGLTSSSSGTTKSSTMIWTSESSPESTQNSSSAAGVCALDESPAIGGVCMCVESYYEHLELSEMLVTLHCQPQKIEVLLKSCFLRTHHWILRDEAFSGCSSISKIEEGHRVQSFMMEKKEGSCGLQLLINNSHAIYSLEVELFQILPAFVQTDYRKLHVSCVYPLVVNVSQTHPYPVVSFPYSTIHVPGTGDTIVILGIFTDPQQSSPLENRPVPLGTPLYVVLRATNSDPDRFALVVNDVFASTSISRMGAVKASYHFVKESCPVSNQLLGGLQANGESLEVMLAFNLIRFFTSDIFYLHGRVTLCDKRAGYLCQPTCSQKSSSAKNWPWKIQGSKDLENSSCWIVFGPVHIIGPNLVVLMAYDCTQGSVLGPMPPATGVQQESG